MINAPAGKHRADRASGQDAIIPGLHDGRVALLSGSPSPVSCLEGLASLADMSMRAHLGGYLRQEWPRSQNDHAVSRR